VYVGRGAVKNNTDKIKIIVCNLGLQSQILPAGTVIAKLQPIEEYKWMAVEAKEEHVQELHEQNNTYNKSLADVLDLNDTTLTSEQLHEL
jgi:hypothetical protein